MNSEHTPKLCECGCGKPVAIAKKTDPRRGWEKGQPIRFVSGHNSRGRSFNRPLKTELAERYEVRDRGYETPCWVWIKHVTRRGYALMHSQEKKRIVSAHRYFYEKFVVPIPDGMQLDHLCRVRHCVNPAHLEPVTARENVRRGLRVALRQRQPE